MNILTKNRILQKGDEYRNNGEWKPVPKNNYGLQIQFTTYKEVRRPSEKPALQQGSETVTRHAHNVETAGSTPAPATISPDRGVVTDNRESSRRETPAHSNDKIPAKAESDESPVASHSATGDASYLPTVVSKKAHKRPFLNPLPAPEIVPCKTCGSILCGGDPCVAPPLANVPAASVPVEFEGEVAKAAKKAKLLSKVKTSIKIDFPHPTPGKDVPIWTGRNGTFNGFGLDAMVIDDRIMFSPIGKRGVGNCTIQFPIAVIPEIIDWLTIQARAAAKLK